MSRAWPAPTRVDVAGVGSMAWERAMRATAASEPARSWARRPSTLQQQFERFGPQALPVSGLQPRDRRERSRGCRQPTHRDVRRRERAGRACGAKRGWHCAKSRGHGPLLRGQSRAWSSPAGGSRGYGPLLRGGAAGDVPCGEIPEGHRRPQRRTRPRVGGQHRRRAVPDRIQPFDG